MVLFFVFDAVWWGWLAHDFFLNTMSHLVVLKEGVLQIKTFSGVFVYTVMSTSLTFFVRMDPRANSLAKAVGIGAFFGFTLFCLFDVTSHTLIRDYPINMVVVDVLWGTFMTSSITAISFKMLEVQDPN